MLRLSPLLLLPLAGCPDYEVFNKMEQVDVFYQTAAEAVDVLLVIDDSKSMGLYQEELGEHFGAFLTYFVDADVDYHVGVVTTDVLKTDAGIIKGEIITPDTENAEQIFSDIVNVGTTGSGTEMGFEAAYLALSEPILSTYNGGFLREDAYQSVIFVSDEEDSSPQSVQDYVNHFIEANGNQRERFIASALVVVDREQCEAENESYIGERYIKAAELTGGIVGDICDTDFEDIVTDISLNASRLHDTFYLSATPAASSLSVSIDDTAIGCDEGIWTYVLLTVKGEETPAILFSSDHLPDMHSQIAVRYNHGSGNPSGFCEGTDTAGATP